MIHVTVAEPTAEDLGYVFNASIKTITGYTGVATELVIPDSFMVDGISVPVEKIGFNAFNGKTALTSVTLPDTLKGIANTRFPDARTYRHQSQTA